jgi:GT2 family glycosyltransferase
MGERTTVVVITRNRSDELVRTLGRLHALEGPPPVVVVDNASDDGTATAVRAKHPWAQVVELDRNAGAAGRNVGVALADTPYVAFADDDSWWAAGALRRAEQHLEAHPRLGLLAARVRLGEDGVDDPTSTVMAASPLPRAPDLPGPSVLGFIACGAVVRRDAFVEVGGFDERYGVGGEEELLAIDLAAAGWDLAYVADVVAVHAPSPLRDPPARRRRIVRNQWWVTLERRPWPVVARRALRQVPAVFTDAATFAGTVDALRGARAALRRRRELPPPVEADLRRLDGVVSDRATRRRVPSPRRSRPSADRARRRDRAVN